MSIIILNGLVSLAAANSDEVIVERWKSSLTKLGADTKEKRFAVGGVSGFLGGLALKKSQDLGASCHWVGWGCRMRTDHRVRFRAQS